MTTLIAVTGLAGSGKDTVANALVPYGGVSIAFADPLKRFAKDVLGFSEEALWGPSEARNVVDPRDAQDVFRLMTNEHSARKCWEQDVFRHPPYSLDRLDHLLIRWFEQHVLTNPLTARNVLQTLGTEYGRMIQPSMWVDYGLRMAQQVLETGSGYDKTKGVVPGVKTPGFVVMTDCRFRNEILAVKKYGGTIINVYGPD